MKASLHKSNTRGYANHGWLDTHHTFSFAGYRDRERMHFGNIRVLNDDVVQGGRGFGTHPHANMEIVSIPLRGALEHRDSTGRHKIIRAGEVQIMSAGTGIEHSEANASSKEDVNFLQIWVLPEKQNIDPRYDQREFPVDKIKNDIINVVAPDNPDALWINQQCWFYLGNLDKNHQHTYELRNREHGVYIFVLEGEMEVEEYFLQKRDGLGLSELEQVAIKPMEDTQFLLIETTMDVG